MTYSVVVDTFEGPLDLLLQLIERSDLAITTLSLTAITEPFVAQMRAKQDGFSPEELADFLVVAARLIYLKSKAILPELIDDALESEPDLASQLRLYQRIVLAAKTLGDRANGGPFSFGRESRSPYSSTIVFSPPAHLTSEDIENGYRQAIARLESITPLSLGTIERVISIEEKMKELSERVRKNLHTSFHRLLSEAGDRGEMIVSFLALLELIKQRVVRIHQQALFHDIELERVSS